MRVGRLPYWELRLTTTGMHMTRCHACLYIYTSCISSHPRRYRMYHKNPREAGYIVKDKLPVNANKYIRVCLNILRAKLKKCMREPICNIKVLPGKPGTPIPKKSAYKRVSSPNLGEYPHEYTNTRTKTRIQSLLCALKAGEDTMRKYKFKGLGFRSMHEKLVQYCNKKGSMGLGDRSYPFANKKIYGLSVEILQSLMKDMNE